MTEWIVNKKLEFGAWLCLLGCVVSVVFFSDSGSIPGMTTAVILGILAGGLYAASVKLKP